MSKATSFEELIVWQKARQLCQDMYPILIRDELSRFQKLKGQMEGSSGSIPDNIAEGFERGGNKEFIQFLYYAKGSCGELRSQIYRAFDYKIITEAEQNEFLAKCKQLSGSISNFIKSIYGSEFVGEKSKFQQNKQS